MKIKLLAVALLAGAALIHQAQAGGHHGGSGGGNGSSSSGGSRGLAAAGYHGARMGGGPSFRSYAPGNFAASRTIYSQRFSSPPVGPMTRTQFQPRFTNSTNNTSASVRRFNPAISSRVGGIDGEASQLVNHRRPTLIDPITGSQRGDPRNRVSPGQPTSNRLHTTANVGNQLRNGNNLPANWKNHVFAQQSANAHPNWDRHHDHWWHHHRCHFFNGSWVIFDLGFYPWWGDWYYPDYYGYANPYPYSYSYDPNYYDSGYQPDNYYNQNGNGYQSGESIVAGAQQELAQQGYYNGAIDGVMGPRTQRAIARYQNNRGLRVTGTLTPDTVEALGLQRVANY
jgi:hypothetical protein